MTLPRVVDGLAGHMEIVRLLGTNSPAVWSCTTMTRSFPSASVFLRRRFRFCGETCMKWEESMRAEHLRALAHEALEALLLERAGMDEDFAFWLDARLAATLPNEARTPLDPEPFRRRAEALLSAAGSGRGRRRWDEWGASIDEAALEGLIGAAEPFLAAGRGADALAILKLDADILNRLVVGRGNNHLVSADFLIRPIEMDKSIAAFQLLTGICKGFFGIIIAAQGLCPLGHRRSDNVAQQRRLACTRRPVHGQNAVALEVTTLFTTIV